MRKPETSDSPEDSTSPGEEVVLSLRDVHTASLPLLQGLNLNVHTREIVGIAGVAGNGQSELVATLAGQIPITSGVLLFENRDVTHHDLRQRRRSGLSVIPEDRRRTGLVTAFSVRDNLVLGDHQRYGTWWMWDRNATDRVTADLIESFDIRTPSPLAPVSRLSGGNQQKVVLARELSRNPKLLVASHPTQGLDPGASQFVHGRLRRARAAGCARRPTLSWRSWRSCGQQIRIH